MAVYFMRAGPTGAVKIGYSERPFTRMRGLQPSVPDRLEMMRLIDGDKTLEKSVHATFKSVRIHGEWFHYHQDMHNDFGTAEMSIHPKPREHRAVLSERRRTLPTSASCERILTICLLFSKHAGLALPTMSTRILNDGKGLVKLTQGRDLTSRSTDLVMQWISDRWRDEWEWPAHIERPPPQEQIEGRRLGFRKAA